MVVSNEQCSLSISGLGSLSVPHKHVKYLMQGLIEVEVHNIFSIMVVIQLEKESLSRYKKMLSQPQKKSCCVTAPVQTKFLSARANCQSEVSAFLQGRSIQYIHHQQSLNLH